MKMENNHFPAKQTHFRQAKARVVIAVDAIVFALHWKGCECVGLLYLMKTHTEMLSFVLLVGNFKSISRLIRH